MVRGHLESIIIYDVYVIDFERESCNAFGKKNFFDIYTKNPYNKIYYIEHFYFKSIEEYIKKRNRGDAIYGNNIRINHYYIDFHFKYNKITLEKVNYFENKTGFNLIKY